MEKTDKKQKLKQEKTVKKPTVTEPGAYPNRFKKGQSGNPNGRPKGKISIRRALYELLAKEGVDGTTIAEALASNLVQVALTTKGQLGTKVTLDILKQTDGLLPVRLEHSGVDGKPMEFREKVDRIKSKITQAQENWEE